MEKKSEISYIEAGYTFEEVLKGADNLGKLIRGEYVPIESPMLRCSFCDAVQLMHEPDEITANGCCTECEDCGRTFFYSVTVERRYLSREEQGDADGYTD